MRVLFGSVLFLLDIWAIAMIFRSTADSGQKALWIALVLFLPFLGFLAWYFRGPKPL